MTLRPETRAAIDAARAAGRVLDRRFGRVGPVRLESPRDPVTRTDRAAERVIRRRLARRFPAVGFLGEESGAAATGPDGRWIVDPLDGTIAFVAGLRIHVSRTAEMARCVVSLWRGPGPGRAVTGARGAMRRAARVVAAGIAVALGAAPSGVQADGVNIPVLVPITGFLSLEGTSQRNGALLAVRSAPAGIEVKAEVQDTGTSPEVAVNALEKAASGGRAIAVVASMLGTQMLAMLPVAATYRVPLLTVSGTARITELGNPWVFRFFPGDAVVKAVHARYAVQELGKRRPALLYQTTAYGQSGREELSRHFKQLGATVVFEEGLDVRVKDMLPVLTKVKEAAPDVLILHLHSGPTALVVRQAAAMGLGLPIVAGSAMHQPATAALLEPGELKGVCAESGSSPISGGSPAMDRWLAAYRQAYGSEPDAFALGQHDGVAMALGAIAAGAKTGEDLRRALSTATYQGLAMTYRSDGKGNMAHSAVIICYDGQTRVPRLTRRYDDVTGVLK
jgi:branched-chain amino acid transport system substrate-binding protein